MEGPILNYRFSQVWDEVGVVEGEVDGDEVGAVEGRGGTQLVSYSDKSMLDGHSVHRTMGVSNMVKYFRLQFSIALPVILRTKGVSRKIFGILRSFGFWEISILLMLMRFPERSNLRRCRRSLYDMSSSLASRSRNFPLISESSRFDRIRTP